MITYPNLYYLKYFADAVDLGSISAAAKKNLVTHPAVSRAIVALETHLNMSLLEHQKKSFQVTEDGHRVAEQARVLLAAASQFSSFNLESQEGPGQISIGLSRTLAQGYLPSLLNEIQKTFPTANIQVRFGATNEIVEAVAKSKLDIGITIGTLKLPTLKQTVINTGAFVLVEAAELSSSAARSRIESRSFLLTEPRFETELLRRQYHRHFGKILPVFCEVGSWEALGHLVQQGFGIGLLPDIVIRNWKRSSYRLIRPPWFACDYEIHIHHSRTPSRNPILQHSIGRLVIEGNR